MCAKQSLRYVDYWLCWYRVVRETRPPTDLE